MEICIEIRNDAVASPDGMVRYGPVCKRPALCTTAPMRLTTTSLHPVQYVPESNAVSFSLVFSPSYCELKTKSVENGYQSGDGTDVLQQKWR